MSTEVGQHHVVPTAYEALILYAAQTCPGVTAPLLATQLDAESGWNLNAVSLVGAQGLEQFVPGVGRRWAKGQPLWNWYDWIPRSSATCFYAPHASRRVSDVIRRVPREYVQAS